MEKVFPTHFEGRMFHIAVFMKITPLLEERLRQYKCEAYSWKRGKTSFDVLCENVETLKWLCKKHKGSYLGMYRGPQFWLNHDGRVV